MKTSGSHISTLTTRGASAFAILEFLCALYGILSLARKDSLENVVSPRTIGGSLLTCYAKPVTPTIVSDIRLSTPTMEDSPSMTFI